MKTALANYKKVCGIKLRIIFKPLNVCISFCTMYVYLKHYKFDGIPIYVYHFYFCIYLIIKKSCNNNYLLI